MSHHRRRGKRHRRPVTAATRRKISAALRGKKHPHRGVRPTAATRARESAAHRGKRHPHRGHPMSAATRAKISRALKGRHHKRRCHCGSSSKHSLKRRRAAYAQGPMAARSLHSSPFLSGSGAAKSTKTRGKKRNKVHGKAHVTKTRNVSVAGPWGSVTIHKKSTKRKTGKCHCPKRHAKHHARLHKHLARHAHHHASKARRQKHGRGKTSVFFQP